MNFGIVSPFLRQGNDLSFNSHNFSSLYGIFCLPESLEESLVIVRVKLLRVYVVDSNISISTNPKRAFSMDHANCLSRVSPGQNRKVIEGKFSVYASEFTPVICPLVAFTEGLLPESLGHDPGHDFRVFRKRTTIRTVRGHDCLPGVADKQETFKSHRPLQTMYRIGLEVSDCLLYTSPSPRDGLLSRMPS